MVLDLLIYSNVLIPKEAASNGHPVKIFHSIGVASLLGGASGGHRPVRAVPPSNTLTVFPRATV